MLEMSSEILVKGITSLKNILPVEVTDEQFIVYVEFYMISSGFKT